MAGEPYFLWAKFTAAASSSAFLEIASNAGFLNNRPDYVLTFTYKAQFTNAAENISDKKYQGN